MDIASLIIELLRILIWPAAATISVYILRTPLSSIIGRLSSLRYKEIEARFTQVLDQADEALEDLPLPESTEPPKLPSKATGSELAQYISPRTEILEAWIRIEVELIDVADRLNLTISSARASSPSSLLEGIFQTGYLDSMIASLIEDLRILRNEAAHEPNFEIKESSVGHYRDIASQIIEHLQSIEEGK